jgi:uncharacterized delta-60 repeat protein
MSSRFMVARFLADGGLDTDFGSGGQAVAAETGFYNALGISTGAKLVAAGMAGENYCPNLPICSSQQFAVTRYLPDGRPDGSFGDDGRVETEFGSGETAAALAMKIQADGKVILAGFTGPFDNLSISEIALARYLPNGILDPHFGTGGKVVTDVVPVTRLVSLSATRTGRDVLVRWRTASEANTRGFNLYRKLKPPRRANGSLGLIPARGGATLGAAYSFVDRRASRTVARYWLQEVKKSGKRLWYGPVAVKR